MMHPTFEEIQGNRCVSEEEAYKLSNSRFALVHGVARRARQIIEEENVKHKAEMKKDVSYNNGKRIVTYIPASIKRDGKLVKAVSLAVDEISSGETNIIIDDDNNTAKEAEDVVEILF